MPHSVVLDLHNHLGPLNGVLFTTCCIWTEAVGRVVEAYRVSDIDEVIPFAFRLEVGDDPRRNAKSLASTARRQDRLRPEPAAEPTRLNATRVRPEAGANSRSAVSSE